jgi:hypothetical protein
MNTPITATPPQPVAAPVRPRRRWLRVVLLFLALAILGPAITIAVMMQSARNAWGAAEAEADQLDPRWRLAEIVTDQPVVPDAENAALYIMAVRAKGGGVSPSAAPRYDKIFEKLPPNTQLNGQQLQLIRGELAKIGKPLAEARLLKDLPTGRFGVTYTDDFIGTLLPNHQNARLMADWLDHDAMVLAQEQRYDEALESCQALLNASRVFKDDTFLISLLIRIAMQNIAVTTIERVVAQGEPSDEALRVTQAMLEREAKDSGWLQAIRGERAGMHHLFTNVRTGKVKLPAASMMMGGPSGLRRSSTIRDWLLDAFPSTMLHYYPEHLRTMTGLVEISKLPIHERVAEIKKWDEARKTSTNPVTQLLAPALSKCHQAERRSQAALRTAMVALACERYRQQHERWPETLEALVQAKLLGALPVDPCDGQPLRYRRTKDGVVIYSVGLDGIDNQGLIDRDNPNNPGVDLGFRLWDPALRRQPPLPPVALPEGQ